MKGCLALIFALVIKFSAQQTCPDPPPPPKCEDDQQICSGGCELGFLN